MELDIGSLEHDLHTVFAANCVPSENTVYSPNENILEALDEYCAESTFHEVRKPLVLIGPPGCGKSAALANWLATRKQTALNNKSRLSSLNPKEEFVFWHVVGCSRQSTYVGHMLNRLMTELREHFEITREVSESEDALSWDFPPFLELAIAKGKVLLVIDGVQRLRSEDGEAKLNWLPLRFPPNVRVVLSATDNMNITNENQEDDDDDDDDDENEDLNENNKNKSRSPTHNMKPTSLEYLTMSNTANNALSQSSSTASSGQISIVGELDDDDDDVGGGMAVGGRGMVTEKEAVGDRSSLENIRCDNILQELLRREWYVVTMQSGLKTQVSIDLIKKFLTIPGDLSAPSDHHNDMMNKHENGGNENNTAITNSSMGSSFFKLTEPGPSSEILYGGDNHSIHSASITINIQDQIHQLNDLILNTGITLFPSQIDALKNIGGGNPLFLSVVLKMLRYSLSHGYNSKKIILELLSCKNNIINLYSKILDIWEHGQEEPSFDEKEQYLQWAKDEGGVPALRDCHPFYEKFLIENNLDENLNPIENDSSSSSSSVLGPSRNNGGGDGPSFASNSSLPLTQERIEEGENEDMSSVEEGSIRIANVKDNENDEGGISDKSIDGQKKKPEKKKKSIEVGSRIEALYGGGEDWYGGEVTKINDDGTYAVLYDDGDEEDEITKDLIKLEGSEEVSVSEDNDEDDYEDDYGDDDDEYADDNEDGDAKEKEKEAEAEEEDNYEDDEDDGYSDEEFASPKKPQEEEEEEEKEEEKKEEEDDGGGYDETGYGDDFEEDDYGEEFDDDDDDDDESESTAMKPMMMKQVKAANAAVKAKASTTSSTSTSSSPATLLRKEARSITEEDLKKIHEQTEAKRIAEEKRLAEEKRIKEEEELRLKEIYEKKQAERDAKRKIEIEETLNILPIEHIGGKYVQGFEATLGYALALLLVARHGLREHELWAMLGDLNHEDELNAKRGVTAEMAAEESLFKLILEHRNKLIRLYRNMDLNHDGTITLHEFRRGIRRLDVGINDLQLEKIVNIVMAKAREENSAISVSMRSNNVMGFTYTELFMLFEDRVSEIHDLRIAKGGEQAEQDQYDMRSTESALDAILNDIGERANSHEFNQSQDRTIGSENEANLLSVLTALGVMRYPSANVLVLPMQCEALREVIFFRYIGSQQQLDSWHSRVAKFFARHTPTMRRCEELPWHLARIRKWPNLMNVLSELKTFELMNSHKILKPELLEYWRKLTLGPLFLSDRMEWEHTKNSRAASDKLKTGDGKSGPHAVALPYEASVRLSELDKQVALGLSDTRTRKHRLDGQVATYDVVAEYNRMVEAWQSASKPSTKRLAQVLYRVGGFLVDFSLKVETTLKSQERLLTDSIHPPFMRKPLVFKATSVAEPGLDTIGIFPYTFDVPTAFGGVESKAAAEKDALRKKNTVGYDLASSTGGGATGMGATSSTGGGIGASNLTLDTTQPNGLLNSDGDVDSNENQINNGRQKEFTISSHYYYDRWLWIQFPWLALNNASAASQKARGEGLLLQTGQASPLPVVGGKSQALVKAEKIIRSSSAGAALKSGDILGLSNGDNDNNNNENNNKKKNGKKNDNNGDQPIEAFMLGESGSVFLDGHDNDKPLLKALEGSKGTERRNWNIKKINPLEKQAPRPAVGLSEDRKTSRVSAALGSTYTIRDIDFSSQKLSKLEQQNYTATFDEGGAKIKAMPSRMKPDPVLTAWVPSIQACEQTSSNNGAGGGGAGNESVCPGIPYSYSSSKAQRAGTRFPSVEKLHIDRLLEKEKKQDKHAADAIGRFGGSYTPRTIKGVIELKHMDDLQAQAPTGVDMAYLPAHTSMFAVPVSETRKADSMARVVKLRKAYDQALGHRQRKVQLLNSMKTKVEEREQHDEFIAETVAIGERTMAALELRVRRMQVELQASDALGDFYDKIVQQCSDTRNPASEKIRLKEMEQQVKLSKLQVRDMLLKRQELYNEKDKIEKHDIVKIKHERNTCIGLRSALKRRLQTVLKSIEKLKADRIELNQSALMNSTEWKLTSSMFGGNVLKKPNLAQSPSSNGINELTMPSVASTGTSSAPPNEANIISNNTSTTSPTTKNKKNKSSLLKNNDDHDENEESIIIEGDEAQHDDSSSPAAAVESNNKKEERTQTPKLRVALKMLKTAEKEKKAEEQRIAMIRVRETEESFGCKFDITDPYSFDAEVLKKMKQGELLHENLLLQKQQLENRIAILKENHEKAKQELEAMRIMNKEDQKKSSTSKKSSSSLSNKDKKAKNHNKDEKASLPIGSSDIAREHRRLEDALSKAEITCNQSFRKLQKSMKSIEDVRAGVQHLGEIILAFDNAGVLPPRPPSTNASATMFILDKEAIQQSFYDNKALHEILIAAEQQVVAVKDELSLGAQMGEGLAGRSPSSNKKDPLDHLPIPKNKNRNKTSYSGSGGGHGKVIRGLGKGTASSLLVTDQEQSEMVKVRVLTKLDNERKTAKSVINHRKEQDDILVLREGKIPAKPRFEAGLKTFLNDSLAGEQTISNQRKANVLAGSKQGATAPKGLALDDVLYQNQPNNNNSNGGGVKKSEKSSSSSSQVTMLGSGDFQTVVDRESLKKSSQGLVARKKAVERRAARIKEAEERKLLEDGGN